KFVGQRIETIVVDFKFQFLIETIQHFRLNAVVDGAIRGPFGHGGLQLQSCWVRLMCECRWPAVSSVRALSGKQKAGVWFRPSATRRGCLRGGSAPTAPPILRT